MDGRQVIDHALPKREEKESSEVEDNKTAPIVRSTNVPVPQDMSNTVSIQKLTGDQWKGMETVFPENTHTKKVFKMLESLGKKSHELFRQNDDGTFCDERDTFIKREANQYKAIGDEYYSPMRKVIESLLSTQVDTSSDIITVVDDRNDQLLSNFPELYNSDWRKLLAYVRETETVEHQGYASEFANAWNGNDSIELTKWFTKNTIILASIGCFNSETKRKNIVKAHKDIASERQKVARQGKEKAKAEKDKPISTNQPVKIKKNASDVFKTCFQQATSGMKAQEKITYDNALKSVKDMFSTTLCGLFGIKNDDNAFDNLTLALRRGLIKESIPDFEQLLRTDCLEVKALIFIFFGAFLFKNRETYSKPKKSKKGKESNKEFRQALGMISAMIKFYKSCVTTSITHESKKEKVTETVTEVDENGVETIVERQVERTVVKEVKKTVYRKAKSILNSSETIEMSHEILEDLKKWVDVLKTIYPYNGRVIFEVAPHLLVISDYSDYIPNAGICPREFQFDLMKSIHQNFENGFFLSLCPSIGTGKTTAVLLVAFYIMTLNERECRGNATKYVIIYVCDTEPVRNQVGEMFFNTEFPFSVMTVNKQNSEELDIRDHNNCKGRSSNAIITDSKAVKLFLNKHNDQADRIVLLLDEPTTCADIKGCFHILNNVDNTAFMCTPRTIEISGTLPTHEERPKILENIKSLHRDAYPNFVCDTISSFTIQIGITILTNEDGSIVAPYSDCKTQQDVRNVLKTLETDPAFLRMCTHEVLSSLYFNMVKHCRHADEGEFKEDSNNVYLVETEELQLPNLDEIFSNPENLTPDKVAEVCFQCLNLLAIQPDSIIEEVCSSEVKSLLNKTTPTENDDDDDIFERVKPIVRDNKVNFYEIGTKEPSKMRGQGLVLTHDVMWFANKYLGELYRHITNYVVGEGTDNAHVFGNIFHELKRYSSTSDALKKKLERESTRTKSATTRAQNEAEITSNATTFQFPISGIVNSKAHCQKFSGHSEPLRVCAQLILGDTVENVKLEDLGVAESVIVLLCAGIGLWSTNSGELTEQYLEVVKKLGSEGKLAFVIADATFVNGSNWPTTDVYIHDSFYRHLVKLHNGDVVEITRSIQVILQALGRAGRYGKSWFAVGRVPKEVSQLISAYARGHPMQVDEAKNMEETFDELVEKKKKQRKDDVSAGLQAINDKTVRNGSKLVVVVQTETSSSVQLLRVQRNSCLGNTDTVNVSNFVSDDNETDNVAEQKDTETPTRLNVRVELESQPQLQPQPYRPPRSNETSHDNGSGQRKQSSNVDVDAPVWRKHGTVQPNTISQNNPYEPKRTHDREQSYDRNGNGFGKSCEIERQPTERHSRFGRDYEQKDEPKQNDRNTSSNKTSSKQYKTNSSVFGNSGGSDSDNWRKK
jgi:hypothetical protein